MLYAIDCGRVEGCNLKQGESVHLEYLLPDAIANGSDFVIFDRNATLGYARAYTDLRDLDKVSWDLFFELPLVGDYAKFFHDRQADPRHADRRERRMAEFLVKHRVALERCLRIGVVDAARRDQVQAILAAGGLHVPVEVRPDWYF